MIACRICHGSKLNPRTPPANRTPCGACAGTGESTAPYDREWHATTVTKTSDELTAMEATGVTVVTYTRTEKHWRPGVYYIALITWRNPEIA